MTRGDVAGRRGHFICSGWAYDRLQLSIAHACREETEAYRSWKSGVAFPQHRRASRIIVAFIANNYFIAYDVLEQ